MVELIRAALLGILQGLTEFLPVSSSGHLSLMRSFFDWKIQSPSTFDVAVHLATLAAVLVVFAPEVGRLLQGIRVLLMSDYWKNPAAVPEYSYQSGRLALLVIIGTVPAVVFGLGAHFCLARFLEHPDPRIVGCLLLITGSLLFVTRSVPPGQRTLIRMRFGDAAVIGLTQAVAILPGISRSGSTISVGLFRGLDRKLAGRFSFLLAVPAIAGAALLKSFDVFKDGITDVGFTVVGMVAAFISGYVALKVLLKVIDRGRLSGFGYYCWAIGLLSVIVGFMRG